MKATITIKPEIIENWESFEASDCDVLCVYIAKYFACQGRTYKTHMGITLDTFGLHSNVPDEIGIRFYYMTSKAKNRRGAIHAEFFFNPEDIQEEINAKGLVHWCNSLADEAISKIAEKMNS